MKNLINIIESKVGKSARFFNKEEINAIISEIKKNKITSFSSKEIEFLKKYYYYNEVYAEILMILIRNKTKKSEKSLLISDLNEIDVIGYNEERTLCYIVAKILKNSKKMDLNDYFLLNKKWQNKKTIACMIVSYDLFKKAKFEEQKNFLVKLNKKMISDREFISSLLVDNFRLFLEDEYKSIYDIIDEKIVIEIIQSDCFKDEIETAAEWGYAEEEYGYNVGLTHLFSKISAEYITEDDLLNCLSERNFNIFKREDIIEKFKVKNSNFVIYDHLVKVDEENIKKQSSFNSEFISMEEFLKLLEKYKN